MLSRIPTTRCEIERAEITKPRFCRADQPSPESQGSIRPDVPGKRGIDPQFARDV